DRRKEYGDARKNRDAAPPRDRTVDPARDSREPVGGGGRHDRRERRRVVKNGSPVQRAAREKPFGRERREPRAERRSQRQQRERRGREPSPPAAIHREDQSADRERRERDFVHVERCRALHAPEEAIRRRERQRGADRQSPAREGVDRHDGQREQNRLRDDE